MESALELSVKTRFGPWYRFLSSGLSSTASLRTPFCIVLLLTFGTLVLDYLTAPSLYNGSTLWATGTLFILTLRAQEEGDSPTPGEAFAWRQSWRLTLFALFHIILVLGGRILAAGLQVASSSYSFSSSAFVLTKFLVLLPTMVLLPLGLWRRVAQVFRPELLASLVVLLTFFPQRIFVTLWPWYSQVLGRGVHRLAAWFVPDLVFLAGSVPRLVGPMLEVSIIFACSGIEGVRLFQSLFALVAAVDWRLLNKRRALLAYFAGIATVLVANFVRISLLVILGNRGLSGWVMRQHGNVGWGVFTMTFLAFLCITYGWMLRAKGLSTNTTATTT